MDGGSRLGSPVRWGRWLMDPSFSFSSIRSSPAQSHPFLPFLPSLASLPLLSRCQPTASCRSYGNGSYRDGGDARLEEEERAA